MPPNASVIRSPTGAWQCLPEKINWGHLLATKGLVTVLLLFVIKPTPAGSLYVGGLFPPNGCAKQLSQRTHAEFLFRASAVGLHRFQTQMQVVCDL